MTKHVNCGGVAIGGGAPISIQSMTNMDSRDEKALLEQIARLEDAGCQIIRMAVPDMESAEVLGRVKKKIHIPMVADIHFDYRLAIASIEAGADKVRINPGNIGSRDRVKAVVDAARPRIVIPMHYRRGSMGFAEIGELTDFTERFTDVRYQDGPLELTKETLDGVVVLTPEV